jgi:light-regulated signal transduction histidine kinase (bacteriophytochrome)
MKKMVESVAAEQTNSKRNQVIIEIGELNNAECDNNLLRQVWVNLISNAVKYSRGKEKPVIQINSEATAHEAVYSIKDNGAGFNMKYADKLFGVFQRLHKMTEYEGTGVGLALVHRIITRHGGRVWAEAEVNKGATFYFSLPVQKGEKSITQQRQYQTI